jgi:hypothetical protein
MPVDAALSGALITAGCGLIAAVIAKLRCRCLVGNSGQEDGEITWSLACGFTEVKLPQPDSKSIEVVPMQDGALYIKKSE